MKNGIYTIIAIALVVGAILYSDSVVMGKDTANQAAQKTANQHAAQTSRQAHKPGHNPAGGNPALAGAKAAKPNGVPNCLSACGNGQDNGINEFNENESHDTDGDGTQVQKEPGPSTTIQAKPHRPVRPGTQVNQNASANATAKGRGASANAVAINNTTVNNRTENVTNVQRPRAQILETNPPQPQPTEETEAQPVVQVVDEQPVAAATTPPAVTMPAGPLPATGPVTFSGILGTSSIIGATYMYIRSRRELMRTGKMPKR